MDHVTGKTFIVVNRLLRIPKIIRLIADFESTAIHISYESLAGFYGIKQSLLVGLTGNRQI
jgi:hypothetical protein